MSYLGCFRLAQDQHAHGHINRKAWSGYGLGFTMASRKIVVRHGGNAEAGSVTAIIQLMSRCCEDPDHKKCGFCGTASLVWGKRAALCHGNYHQDLT